MAERFVRVQVSDLQASYHSTYAGNMHVALSLPHVLGLDARPTSSAEHALVISSHSAGVQLPWQASSLRALLLHCWTPCCVQ